LVAWEKKYFIFIDLGEFSFWAKLHKIFKNIGEYSPLAKIR
jgi:hypothetical protein